MLEQEALLSALYTDSSAHSLLGKCATLCGEHAPGSIQRLAGRKIKEVPSQKIFSSDGYNTYEFGQKLLGVRKSKTQLFSQRDQMLSRKMTKWGTQGANVLYAMYHDNLDFVRWAKSQGLCIAVDVYISPQTNNIMQDEFAEFPDWGGCPAESIVRQGNQMWRQIAELADLLICPSEWVAEGIRTLTPEASEKIRIVPYGCSINYEGKSNQPQPGRILFAGGDALRKGLHYLARATTRLKASNPAIDVRIAGMLPPEVVSHPICRDLNFLGKLNSDQMKEEYLSADLFVLPALSEGFAGVVSEAIGAGCPVVVTSEAGSPIEDGREGLIVPSRNAEALAEAIERMVGDRTFRNACAAACLQQAEFYSEAQWRDRLSTTILEGVALAASSDLVAANGIKK
jgi:glycosyltransferase involved in cell wall biosynthesis